MLPAPQVLVESKEENPHAAQVDGGFVRPVRSD